MYGKHWTDDQKLRQRQVVSRGPKNPMWKGGITPQSMMFISTIEWKDLATSVRKRDSFTCQACGKDHVAIVHHLIPRNLDAEKRLWLDSQNLVTICSQCHSHLEPWQWKQLPGLSEIINHYERNGLHLPKSQVHSLLIKLNAKTNNSQRPEIEYKILSQSAP
jgi:hypothetical protein